MTPTKQQDKMWVEVLKWMGWTQHANGHWYFKVTENQTDCLRGGQFPPPLTLDALHEATGKLESRYWNTFVKELAIACAVECENPANSLMARIITINASAEQRLPALWSTITTERIK